MKKKRKGSRYNLKQAIADLRDRHPLWNARDIAVGLDAMIEQPSSRHLNLAPLQSWIDAAPGKRRWVEFYDDKRTHERVRGYINNN
jgi:hypothetical protein